MTENPRVSHYSAEGTIYTRLLSLVILLSFSFWRYYRAILVSFICLKLAGDDDSCDVASAKGVQWKCYSWHHPFCRIAFPSIEM